MHTCKLLGRIKLGIEVINTFKLEKTPGIPGLMEGVDTGCLYSGKASAYSQTGRHRLQPEHTVQKCYRATIRSLNKTDLVV